MLLHIIGHTISHDGDSVTGEKGLFRVRVDGPCDGDHASVAPPRDRVRRQIILVRRHDGKPEVVPVGGMRGNG